MNYIVLTEHARYPANHSTWPIHIPQLKFSRLFAIYNLVATFDDTGATITQQVITAGKTMATPKTIRLFAEISVLNEILNDDSKIWKLRQCIDPYSVSVKRHGILRQAIAQLYRMQHPIDVENLSWYLADHGLLDDVGGYRYLQYIAKFHYSASLGSHHTVHPANSVETVSYQVGSGPIKKG
jgi:hypothetical protein